MSCPRCKSEKIFPASETCSQCQVCLYHGPNGDFEGEIIDIVAFGIVLNKLDGVDLILKALDERYRTHGCLASSDLYQGILKSLQGLKADGQMVPIIMRPVEETEKPRFTIIKGGKDG